MADYEAVLVSRANQSATAPTLSEVGPIPFATLTYVDELNGDGRADLSVQPEALTADVKQRLRDLKTYPSELKVFADGTVVWAGPVIGRQLQSGTCTLHARGLGYYLHGMWVTSDLTYTATDQFTIAKGLVDHWQNLAYGDFGIDTSSISTSGVTRDRTYLASELHNIHQRLVELGQVDNGFDWYVDPDTRDLTLSSPTRGSDLTGSVILDRRAITADSIVAMVGAGDLASEAFGLATSYDSPPLTSTKSDTTLRSTFGRWGVAATFDGVTVQATLDGHTQKLLDDRDSQLLSPAPQLTPINDVDTDSFDVGDTVAFEFDGGLGVETADLRVTVKQVTVDEQGTERLQAEFG